MRHLNLSQVRRCCLSLFIIFHLTIISCWMFSAHPWAYALADHFRKYVLFLGLDQDYSVFAPLPRNENIHLLTLVVYADGSTAVVSFPRIDRLPMIDRLWNERWRKFGHDNFAYSNEPSFMRDFARFSARQANIYGVPPQLVSISRYTVPIPPPEKGLGTSLPLHYRQKTLVNYEVIPEDLQ